MSTFYGGKSSNIQLSSLTYDKIYCTHAQLEANAQEDDILPGHCALVEYSYAVPIPLEQDPSENPGQKIADDITKIYYFQESDETYTYFYITPEGQERVEENYQSIVGDIPALYKKFDNIGVDEDKAKSYDSTVWYKIKDENGIYKYIEIASLNVDTEIIKNKIEKIESSYDTAKKLLYAGDPIEEGASLDEPANNTLSKYYKDAAGKASQINGWYDTVYDQKEDIDEVARDIDEAAELIAGQKNNIDEAAENIIKKSNDLNTLFEKDNLEGKIEQLITAIGNGENVAILTSTVADYDSENTYYLDHKETTVGDTTTIINSWKVLNQNYIPRPDDPTGNEDEDEDEDKSFFLKYDAEGEKWATLQESDLPSHTHSSANITDLDLNQYAIKENVQEEFKTINDSISFSIEGSSDSTISLKDKIGSIENSIKAINDSISYSDEGEDESKPPVPIKDKIADIEDSIEVINNSISFPPSWDDPTYLSSLQTKISDIDSAIEAINDSISYSDEDEDEDESKPPVPIKDKISSIESSIEAINTNLLFTNEDDSTSKIPLQTKISNIDSAIGSIEDSIEVINNSISFPLSEDDTTPLSPLQTKISDIDSAIEAINGSISYQDEDDESKPPVSIKDKISSIESSIENALTDKNKTYKKFQVILKSQFNDALLEDNVITFVTEDTTTSDT